MIFRDKMKRRMNRACRGFLIAASLCGVIGAYSRVSADPVKPLTDRQFDQALVEMSGEYDKDVTRQQAERSPYITNRLIVKSEDDRLDPEDYGAVDAIQDQDGLYLMQFKTAAAARRAEKKLEKEETTRYAEPDVLLFASEDEESSKAALDELMAAADDAYWNISFMGLDAYQDMICSQNYNKAITVAVLDTGVSFSHPLLQDRLLTSRAVSYVKNYSADEDQVSSGKFHGTHVAGIIAKATEKLSVSLLPVRVLDSTSAMSGPVSAVLNGIQYAVDQGAQVINLSMAGAIGSGTAANVVLQSLQEKIQYAVSKGVVVVVSAGNQYMEISSKRIVPACIPECVVVGAVDSNKTIWHAGAGKGSNYGDTLDVVAPGVKIKSATLNKDYSYGTGTSMAAPHISAEAAMLRMVYSSYSAAQIESLIQQNTEDLGAAGKDPYYGYGLAQLTHLSGLVYTVSYKPGDHGTFAGTTYKVAGGLETPDPPAVTGEKNYQFTGWSPQRSSTVTGNVEYVAQWKYRYASSKPRANITYQVPLKKNQKTGALKVTGLAGGDKVVSWKSSNNKIASVKGKTNGSCTVKAGSKNGKATITAVTDSGKKVIFKIKVQKKIVRTKKIQIDKKKVVLNKGESFRLEPVLYPVSSAEKVTFRSNKKKIASVSKSGVVKAKKSGKTKIIITSGNKKRTITVVVR